MPSFDIMSEPDMHEVKNATDQAVRELAQRFDFRGTESEIKVLDDGFDLIANSEEKVNAVLDVLKDKFVKRKISLKFLDAKAPLPAGGKFFKLHVDLKKGITKDHAKQIVQIIKDEKEMKVTPSIQGETVRVTGKKRDELQQAIALLRAKEFPVELSFGNFRE
jgi:uncharacterized protein YajQ (UPF0234 family)